MAKPDLWVQFHQTLQEQQWLPPHARLVLAVSGGSDSMALLGLVARSAPDFQWTVQVVHVHHGLRGPAADRDAALVAAWADRFGFDCRVVRIQVMAGHGQSWEMVARDERRRVLEQAAGPAGWVVLAHHRDDQAETVLYRILRGTGVGGLEGMRPVAGRFVRPLLAMTQDDLRSWRIQAGIDAHDDETNQSLVFTRNRLRLALLPRLRAEYNPRVDEALLRLAASARDVNDWAQSEVKRWFSSHWDPQVAPGQHRLREARHLPGPVFDRALRQAARECGFSLTESQLRAARQGPTGWPHRYQVTWQADDLWLSAPSDAVAAWPDQPLALAVPGKTSIPCGVVCVAVGATGPWSSVVTRSLGTLYVRGWRPGDRLELPGGTKKLQDVFVDAHVPRRWRAVWPVIAAEQRGAPIVAVVGLQVAAPYRAGPDDPGWVLTWRRGDELRDAGGGSFGV